MEEKKKWYLDWKVWGIITLVMFVIFAFYNNYKENKGWEWQNKDWNYVGEKFYTFEDAINGWYCRWEDCRDIEIEENTKAKECYCGRTEKWVKLIYTERIKNQVFEWENFDASNETNITGVM